MRHLYTDWLGSVYDVWPNAKHSSDIVEAILNEIIYFEPTYVTVQYTRALVNAQERRLHIYLAANRDLRKLSDSCPQADL